MENVKRNEKEIEVGGQKILLRPTFENQVAMESLVGSLMWVGWKFSRGSKDLKEMPGLPMCAQLIYCFQAATKPEDPTLKKFSLEEIFEMVMIDGVAVVKDVMQFILNITNGNKLQADEPLEAEKKS